jgi:hypothetical protein
MQYAITQTTATRAPCVVYMVLLLVGGGGGGEARGESTRYTGGEGVRERAEGSEEGGSPGVSGDPS